MTQLVVVRWADLQGTGFSRQDPRSAPQAFWAAGERLLRTDLSQPPEAVRTTLPHPVWTLRHLEVDGRGHWCFAVQGRRGPFGVAGGCRFGFVPDDVLPAQAWELGRAQVAEQEPDPAAPAPELVEGVLAGICLGRPRLPVGHDPAAAAAVIAAVLRVVPGPVARRWSWSTCLLFRPEPADRWVVAGLWPPEFERWDPVLAARTAQLFRTPAPTPAELLQEPDGEQLVRHLPGLVRYARAGIELDPELSHTAGDMREVLDHVARHELPLTVHDLPAALSWPNGPRKLHADLAVLRDWVDADWPAARAALATQHDQVIVAALFDALLDLQFATAENVLGLPTPAEPADPAWAARLAELIRDVYPQTRDRAHLIERYAAPGGPLEDVDDLRALHEWLRDDLALPLRSHGRLYPARPGAVVALINAERALTRAAEGELRRCPDRLQVVLEGAAHLAALSPDNAADLVDALAPRKNGQGEARRDQVARLTTALVAAAGAEEDGAAAGWLADLLLHLTHLNRDDLLRPAMYGGLAALRAQGLTTLLEHPALLGVTREIQCGTDAPAEIMEMFYQDQEALHLASRPQQPLPVEARQRVGPQAYGPRLRQSGARPVQRVSYESETTLYQSTVARPEPQVPPFTRRRLVTVGAALAVILSGTTVAVLTLRHDEPAARQPAPASPAPSPSAVVVPPAPVDAVAVRVLEPALHPAAGRDQQRQFVLNRLVPDLNRGHLLVAVVLTGHAAPGEGERLAGSVAANLAKALPDNPPFRVRAAPPPPGTSAGTVTVAVVLMAPGTR